MTQLQIEECFKDINCINEAKKIYKTLAKKLHPDVGGSEEEFKILNSVYNHIIEHNIYFSNNSKFDLELEKIISQILHYENIIIDIIGTWIWLDGNTKPIKNILKDLGFKWAPKKKKWYYGEMKGRNLKPKPMEDIKAKYGCETLKTEGSRRLGI